MITAHSEPNAVSWVQWVRNKIYTEDPKTTRYMLTPEIYNQLDRYDKRRVKHFLGDHNCFNYFYNKRLKAYEAKRNALDNKNATRNP